MAHKSTRRLYWDATYNTRELGGYRTQDGREIGERRFIRSDNLARLSAEGRAALLDYGIRTIIDLRMPYELQLDPPPVFDEQGGYHELPIYHNISLIDPADVAGARMLDRFTSRQESYCFQLKRHRQRFATVMRTIAQAPDGPVLIYCHVGKDRTGMITALLLALADVTPADIDANYAESAENLQPLLDEWLGKVAHDPARTERLKQAMDALPGTMLGVLSFLEREFGGAEAYLLKAGLNQGEVESIRKRLLL